MPVIIILAIITFYPFVYLIFLSLQDWRLTGTAGLQISFCGLKNFKVLFLSHRFINSIIRSLFYVGLGVSIEFCLGLGLSLIFNKEFKGKRIIMPFFIMPVGITPIVASLTWKILYDSEYGLISFFLSLTGLASPQWLTNPRLALLSCIIIDIWRWTPFVMLVFLAGLGALPKEPFEAARVEGASKWQTLRYLTLPMLIPIAGIILLIRTMDAFKAFDIIFGLTGGGPGVATETMNIWLFFTNFRYLKFGLGAAAGVLMLGITIVTSVLLINLLGMKIVKPK